MRAVTGAIYPSNGYRCLFLKAYVLVSFQALVLPAPLLFLDSR